MANNNPIAYADLVKPDSSITDLIKQLEELIRVYDNAKSKIQSAAQQTAQSVQGVSGATEEQRKVIQKAAEQSEKLVSEYRDLSSASWKAKQAFVEAAAAKKESAQIDKLITQINTSAVGSYNRLSAQYRLNKIRLNELSAEQRKAKEVGGQLEAETAAIYEEMKRLQEATGKHQLNVGNYADATKNLRTELMELTNQLAQMRLNGEAGSEEYAKMAERAGKLRDAVSDARQEVSNMASDTSKLDSVSRGASAVQGGMSALTSTIALMGATSETATKAQKNLGYAVGIVSGLIAAQNALQKQSALMIGIRTLQMKAAAKAEALKAAATKSATGATSANIVATKAATVAQAAFNIVANANPYVLLAMALITVVGALVAFSAGTAKASDKQKKFLEELTASMKALREYREELMNLEQVNRDEEVKRLQHEIDLRKAAGKDALDLEKKLYEAKKARWENERKWYLAEVTQIDENWKKVNSLANEIQRIRTLQEKYSKMGLNFKVSYTVGGKTADWKPAELISVLQEQLDEYKNALTIGLRVKAEGEDIEREEQLRLANRRKETAEAAKNARKAEIDAERSAQDARLNLIANSYEKERETLKVNAGRRIVDLQRRLEEEKNLTARARQAIADEISAINSQLYRDMLAAEQRYQKGLRDIQRANEDLQMDLMEDSAAKREKMLSVSYSRQLDALLDMLNDAASLTQEQEEALQKQVYLVYKKSEKEFERLRMTNEQESLKHQKEAIQLRLDAIEEGSEEELNLLQEKIEKERRIELLENKMRAEEVRQDEVEINAKYDKKLLKQTQEFALKRAKMLLDMQQALAKSEFDLTQKNERQKTAFMLQQERERLQNLLEYDKTLTKIERQTLANMIADIDRQIAELPYNNLWEVLGIGLDDKQQDALGTALSSIKDGIDSIAESWVQAAEKAVQSADKQVEAARKVLEAEIEAREKGYANNVIGAQKELQLAQRTQAKAIAEKEKAQRAQLAIDTVTQASSLITATANLWSSLGGIPVVGPALALAAIAAMWVSFGVAKIKAAQVAGSGASEQYGEGTVELLEGGSHASGKDIDLGVKRDGTRRRAEGGEFFAVINKRNSAKYRNVIPDVINSFNDGTFADRYQRANTVLSGVALSVVGGHSSVDVSRIEKDVRAIREQGDEVRFLDSNGNMVIRYKNLTRKIKS